MGEIISLLVGIGLIFLSTKYLKGLIIWCYSSFKIMGRIVLAIVIMGINQALTNAILGQVHAVLWPSVITGIIVAILYPR